MRVMAGQFAAVGAALACAFAATAAVAAEGHSGGGMPQLDATKFAPQIIWLAITFAVLYVLMAKMALPRVAEVLETRADHINDDLRRAEEARAESEAVMLAYEQALAEARGKAQAEARTATAVLQREAADADARIASAKLAAMANVRSVAAEVAVAAVRRVGGFDVDAGRAAAAVDAETGGRA